MSVVLHTQQNFTVVRQIANHTDTATYYVKAVIRNAYTDEIIATLLLEDKGSLRFKKDWRVPADPSGEGFYVSIVTSVYSDSGYTTKSENYGDEENTYLVEDRQPRLSGGGGGIDSRTVRRIFKEEFEASKPEPIEIPEMPKMPKMRFDEVLKAVEGLKTSLKPEKVKPTDLSPVISALHSVVKAVEAKDVTPETDLSPVLEAINSLDGKHDEGVRHTADRIQTAEGATVEQIAAKVAEMLKQTTFTIAPTTATMKVPDEKEEKEEKFDINALAS